VSCLTGLPLRRCAIPNARTSARFCRLRPEKLELFFLTSFRGRKRRTPQCRRPPGRGGGRETSGGLKPLDPDRAFGMTAKIKSRAGLRRARAASIHRYTRYPPPIGMP